MRVLVGPDARSGWVRIGFRPYVDITVADVAWLVDPGPAASVTVDDIPTETFVLVRFSLVAPPASAGPRPLGELRFFYAGGGISLHGDFAATCDLVDGAGAPGGSCSLEPPVIGP